MDLLKNITIHTGDALTVLKTLPSESVNCVVTSPPYWGLRTYFDESDPAELHALQQGLESSPGEFISKLVEVFREVKRVLRKDGVCWINMGDSYAGQRGGFAAEKSTLQGSKQGKSRGASRMKKANGRHGMTDMPNFNHQVGGIKSKDLCGMPWRLAFALQDDGWYLRRDIILAKQNPMPETVNDRPTTAHEYMFMLTKSRRYWYDNKAIMEPASNKTHERVSRAKLGQKSNPDEKRNGIRPRHTYFPANWAKGEGRKRTAIEHNTSEGRVKQNGTFPGRMMAVVAIRNKRSVWEVWSSPYPGEHFATFSPKWIEPCILAGCPKGGVVLDCYGGVGTTAGVARHHGRSCILIELNPKSVEQIPGRIEQVVRELRGIKRLKPVPPAQQRLQLT